MDKMSHNPYTAYLLLDVKRNQNQSFELTVIASFQTNCAQVQSKHTDIVLTDCTVSVNKPFHPQWKVHVVVCVCVWDRWGEDRERTGRRGRAGAQIWAGAEDGTMYLAVVLVVVRHSTGAEHTQKNVYEFCMSVFCSFMCVCVCVCTCKQNDNRTGQCGHSHAV